MPKFTLPLTSNCSCTTITLSCIVIQSLIYPHLSKILFSSDPGVCLCCIYFTITGKSSFEDSWDNGL